MIEKFIIAIDGGELILNSFRNFRSFIHIFILFTNNRIFLITIFKIHDRKSNFECNFLAFLKIFIKHMFSIKQIVVFLKSLH